MKHKLEVYITVAIILAILGMGYTALSGVEEVVVTTVPTVYVAIPAEMSVDGVLSKNYQPDQDIILKADVNDDTEIITENISWAILTGDVYNPTQTPIGKGETLHIKGGTLKVGKHTFFVTYSDKDGEGAEYVYSIEINTPTNRTELIHDERPIKNYDGYVMNGSTTVTHMSSGLTWVIVDDGYDRTYSEATEYAKAMSSKNGKTWYIPTLNEWSTIAHLGNNGSHLLDEPFTGLKSGAKYWTRSAPKHAKTVAGSNVAYAIEVAAIVGGGQNLRAGYGVVPLDATCYTILVSKGE